jgi:hypothetical protein
MTTRIEERNDEGGSVMTWEDVSEAEEASGGKAEALERLGVQVRHGESAGVVDMYERAAWAHGATVEETDAVIADAKAPALRRALGLGVQS